MQEPELMLDPPYATMADFYADVERNLVLVLDAYAELGVAPTCRAGCDACCHQLVMTTMAEAREAARVIAEASEAIQEVLRERLAAWHVQTLDLRRSLQAASDDSLEALVEDLAATYWQRRLACPFLSEGHCAIYEGRPLACRHHFAVSEPTLCTAGDEAVIDRMETMDEAFFFAQEAIPEEAAEIGMFPELVALALEESAASDF